MRRIDVPIILKAAAASGAAALIVLVSGCMAYRGPAGVEAAIERKAGVELHRDLGIKLGPLSTKVAASIVGHGDGDPDFSDLTGISVTVFEVTKRAGTPPEPITAADLGVSGWRPMIDSRSNGEQLLVLAKTDGPEIREMMLLSIESDEVVVARLKGHLDRLIRKTLAGAEHDGAHGARAAIGFGAN
jgi:hypothetical protein